MRGKKGTLWVTQLGTLHGSRGHYMIAVCISWKQGTLRGEQGTLHESRPHYMGTGHIAWDQGTLHGSRTHFTLWGTQLGTLYGTDPGHITWNRLQGTLHGVVHREHCMGLTAGDIR